MKRYCLVGDNVYPDAVKNLEAHGFCVKVFPTSSRLEAAVASHIDLSLLSLQSTLFISPVLLHENEDFFESLAKEKGFTLLPVSHPPRLALSL